MIINKIQEYHKRLFQKKPFGSLLEIFSNKSYLLKTFNSEFGETKIWFTDQTSQPLEYGN